MIKEPYLFTKYPPTTFTTDQSIKPKTFIHIQYMKRDPLTVWASLWEGNSLLTGPKPNKNDKYAKIVWSLGPLHNNLSYCTQSIYVCVAIWAMNIISKRFSDIGINSGEWPEHWSYVLIDSVTVSGRLKMLNKWTRRRRGSDMTNEGERFNWDEKVPCLHAACVWTCWTWCFNINLTNMINSNSMDVLNGFFSHILMKISIFLG